MCENNPTESVIKTLTKLQLEKTVRLVQQTTTLGPALGKVAPHTEIELQSIMNASMRASNAHGKAIYALSRVSTFMW